MMRLETTALLFNTNKMRVKIQALTALVIIGSIFSSCSQQGDNKGDKLFKQQEYEAAIEAYTADLEFKPNHVRSLYNRGRAYEELGDFDKAEADYALALENDRNNFQLLLSLANLHHKERNYTNALLYANKAAEIPGAPAMANFMKARAFHQMGKPEDALKSYDAAIHIDKNFGQAYYNRGLLKVAMKNIKGACIDLQLAAGLEYPGSQDAYEKYCN